MTDDVILNEMEAIYDNPDRAEILIEALQDAPSLQDLWMAVRNDRPYHFGIGIAFCNIVDDYVEKLAISDNEGNFSKK